MTFTYGSLFSGIGGIDLGLERAGMRCAWQVEIDEFCRKVLEKQWPGIARYGDIRNVGKHNLEEVDIVTGGFPCQDISSAGAKVGITGKQSSLWGEMFRVVCELRPRFVLVENVSALLHRGIDTVLGNLASIGYDAEWQVLRACDFDLPHIRERIFILAYPMQRGRARILRDEPERCYQAFSGNRTSPALDNVWHRLTQFEQRTGEPSVLGSYDGIPNWVDRLGAVGNAVVSQIAEYVGRCILDACADREVSA